MKSFKVFALCFCVFALTLASAAAQDVLWDYEDLKKVSDYLVSECKRSKRIADFTKEKGHVPTVILGEIGTDSNTRLTSNQSTQLAKRLQDALINSEVLDFVSDSGERKALRGEKADQDFHASEGTAKPIDNESAADFMLLGDVYFVSQKKQTVTYSVMIQLHDIERNKIIFSKEFLVKAESRKATTFDERAFVSPKPPKKGWKAFPTFSVGVPLLARDFELDEDKGSAECEFDAVGLAFDISIHNVNLDNKFTVLVKLGFGALFGDMIVNYENYRTASKNTSYGYDTYEDGEARLNEITDFTAYGKLGIGRAFGSRVMFIPAIGAGITGDYMYADKTEKIYSGYNVTLDAFLNVSLLIPTAQKWTFAVTLEASTNLCGTGYFTDLGKYTIEAQNSNRLMPTIDVGLCVMIPAGLINAMTRADNPPR